nr:DUF2800 domain-containing protein [Limosilactobacillus reuteri]
MLKQEHTGFNFKGTRHKKKFTELFSKEIIKPAGKPTLVPNSDRRQSIGKSNPKDEFKEEQ